MWTKYENKALASDEPPALTTVDLDELVCECCGILALSPHHCHPGSSIEVSYRRGHDFIAIGCRDCGAPFAHIRIVARSAKRINSLPHRCEEPGCTHTFDEHEQIFISSRCHPDRLAAAYSKNHGTLGVYCEECKKHFLTVKVWTPPVVSPTLSPAATVH